MRVKSRLLLMGTVGAAAVAAGLLGGPAAQAESISMVTVGNPDNADDTHGYGGVNYVYNIGKYEVTAGQYTEFLNAVAGTDTYGLYHTLMDSDSFGCQITRHGSSGNYTYDFSGRPSGTEADWANRPVNYVSFWDAARFANWLHNGQPTGGQGAGTTEDGAYINIGNQTAFARQPGALYWIPTEDEWYKAAYYKGGGTNAGYWGYPTQSDSTPSNDLTDPDPGNNATFNDSGYTIDSPYYRTEVAAHENSESAYGTFDQGGNVWEWNETAIGSSRGGRGGSFHHYSGYLHASSRDSVVPSYEYYTVGFRVASAVPEPGCITALVGIAVMGLIWWWRRK